MTVLRLNEEGMSVFGQYIDRLTTDDPMAFPTELLTAGHNSEVIGGDCTELDKFDLDDKYATSSSLDALISDLEISSPERDAGFWTWLSCYLFEKICPRKKGSYHPQGRERWIADTENYQRYYRHLLAGPWGVYRAHIENPDRAIAVLSGPVNVGGEIFAQIASRKQFVTNAAVVELTRLLYWDDEECKTRRGSGSSGPGSPRRLADFLWQLDRTWDLYGMTVEDLLDKLPTEFDRFR